MCYTQGSVSLTEAHGSLSKREEAVGLADGRFF